MPVEKTSITISEEKKALNNREITLACNASRKANASMNRP